VNIDITTNGADVIADVRRFARDASSKAVVRALNKTAAQARTEGSRAVRNAGYNIKSSAIKKSFSIKRATPSNLEVRLVATGRPIPLINYGARPTKRGVMVTVKGGRTLFRHAFIAKMKNGHKGVFERVGAALTKQKRDVGGRLRRINTPIQELYGPSIPNSLANGAVTAALMRKIEQKFPEILAHELDWLERQG